MDLRQTNLETPPNHSSGCTVDMGMEAKKRGREAAAAPSAELEAGGDPGDGKGQPETNFEDEFDRTCQWKNARFEAGLC